jgi:serine/threonine protein kinase
MVTTAPGFGILLGNGRPCENANFWGNHRGDLDEFVRQLLESSLLSADEASTLRATLNAEADDAQSLASKLVRAGKLTEYQARAILHGDTQFLVFGEYVVLDKLDEGGMGVVLKALHRRMDRLVAVKILPPSAVHSPEAVQRFYREAKATAKLSHPHIVATHDAGEHAGVHYLVMEYVEGKDLARLVKERGPLSVEQTLNCVIQAARGLDYAHHHGIIHRDIKPSNLLSDREGTVKILDLGLAHLESVGGQQDQLTGTGEIMGTVDYMAPEQARDTKHADARADIYSLGVTLWYLLTGRPLFEGETTVEKLMGHQTQPIPSLQDACPAASAALDAVFARMVAKTPESRYQTMAEVIVDLDRCRSATATSAPALSIAADEDAQPEEFLRVMVAPSPQRSMPARQASRAAAVGVAAKIAAAADPHATLDVAGPQVATDPKTEQSLPGGRMVTPATKKVRRPPRPPWWQDRRKLVVAGAGGLLLLLLAVWVIVRDKAGREVARIEVPDGGSVTVETATDGGGAKLSSWRLPAGAPPPAIAPFDEKKAKEHQAAWAKHLGVQVEVENSVGMNSC